MRGPAALTLLAAAWLAGGCSGEPVAAPEPADTSVRATLRLPEGATAPPTLWITYEREGSNLESETDWPADGIVRWRALEPVEHHLGVSVEGYATWSTLVDVPKDEVLDLGTIELTVGRALRGRVVDSTGKPLVGVDVETGSEFTPSFRLAKTDADGAFRLDNLPEEAVRVVVWHTHGLWEAFTSPAAGSDEEWTLTIARGGQVRVLVRNADGDPVPDATVMVQYDFDASRTSSTVVHWETDADGVASGSLPVGACRITHVPTDGRPELHRARREVEIEEGETYEIELEID